MLQTKTYWALSGITSRGSATGVRNCQTMYRTKLTTDKQNDPSPVVCGGFFMVIGNFALKLASLRLTGK